LHSVADELGRPLRDLRISVTDRCNFRCAYCMPAGIYGRDYEFLPKPQLLTFEEVERLARILVGLGVEKIRITGGEPLLRAELPKLLGRLAALEGLRDLTLTTNGYLLARQARALREAGLRRITVSLDSHDDEIFKRMSGQRYGPRRVLDAIEAAAAAGLQPIKVNCVVQRGVNDGELVELARYFRGTGHILRFIEFMDVGTLNDWNLERVVTATAGCCRAQLPRRSGQPLPLRGWQRRDRDHLLGEPAVLCWLHPPAAHHRRQARDLPVRGRR
jgi:cyclic pyranopterin phosphate synthase